MDTFNMNGYLWHIIFVDPFDQKLIDRTGKMKVATTDPYNLCIYLSMNLRGDFLIRVLIHELAHCTMFSFDLIDDIHKMVYPEYWVIIEEWVCNFISDYGLRMFKIAYSIVNNYNAWMFVPYELEKLIS